MSMQDQIRSLTQDKMDLKMKLAFADKILESKRWAVDPASGWQICAFCFACRDLNGPGTTVHYPRCLIATYDSIKVV